MKRTLLILLATLTGTGVLLPSCNKDDKNTSERHVSLEIKNLAFTMPVIGSTGEYDSIIAFNFLMNIDSFIKLQNPDFDTSNIKSVKMTACVVWMYPDTGKNNFSNFHTCSIGMDAPTAINHLKVSTFTDIVDTPAYFLSIPKTYDWNCKEYFKSDSIHFQLYGNIRRPTTDSLNCKINMNYDFILSK